MPSARSKDLRARLAHVDALLAMSRDQRRRRGVRLSKLDLWAERHTLERMIRLEDTSTSFNRDPDSTVSGQ